ncbi:hypothetical protein Anas_05967 [Armadillidium nasatum]|uniref:Uncharacterized protein n=1 Tax=Armadillidium nasatum TaxID=96803 RepID=A0A5N5T9F7_9CRUS|nr:hypothetical protein Anas_05967 [Armadillidium nasatum]
MKIFGLFVSAFICILVNFREATFNEVVEREESTRKNVPFISASDGKVPESAMVKQFDRFMKVYEAAFKKSSLYKRSKPEEKLIHDQQIEDLKQLLKTRKIRNDEDAEIIEWIKELVQLSDFNLWKTMNLVLSGNLFFGFTKENVRRRDENIPPRDELYN